jgi:hypothetical protein
MKKVLLMTVFLFGMYHTVFCGPNKNALVGLDMYIATDVVDTTGYCMVDSMLTVGVAVTNVSELYAFQASVTYDDSKLRLISVSKNSGGMAALLEKNGGTIFFDSIPTPKQIELHGTLVGNNRAHSVSGNGYLGFITFKKLTSDTVGLTMNNVMLSNFDEVADNEMPLLNGKIVPGTIAVRYKAAAFSKKVSPNVNSMITLSKKNGIQSDAVVLDIMGRPYRVHNNSKQKFASGMYIVHHLNNSTK